MPDMATFGEKLWAMVKAKRLGYRQFAKLAGVSVDTLQRLKKMTSADDMRPGSFQAIATALGMSAEELEAALGDAGDGLPAGQYHDPLAKPDFQRSGWLARIGSIAAGKATDFELNIAADKDVPGALYHAPQEGPAVLIAAGDSMQPLIDDGDVVVIARKFWRPPQTGDIVAVSLVQERGHTIKHLDILKDGRWQLSPHNTHKHRPQTFEPAEIKAAAVVVGWYHAMHKPRAAKK